MKIVKFCSFNLDYHNANMNTFRLILITCINFCSDSTDLRWRFNCCWHQRIRCWRNEHSALIVQLLLLVVWWLIYSPAHTKLWCHILIHVRSRSCLQIRTTLHVWGVVRCWKNIWLIEMFGNLSKNPFLSTKKKNRRNLKFVPAFPAAP